MKETPEKQAEFDPETYTNPILEECYRIKAEISAQFKTVEEYYLYLKAKEEEDKRNGIKYVPILTCPNIKRQKNPRKMSNC